MSSERLNLPPVPSVARITQPANEDTALFILRSVLKTGAHLPAGKWTSLVKLLWDSPPNPGPFYRVFREWTPSGRARNIKTLVEALLCHYGEFGTIENPYPSTIQALARRLSSEAAVATLEDRQHRDADTRRVQARSLENDYQEGALGMLPEGIGVDAPRVRGAPPLRQQELQDACAILAQNPRSTNSHFRPVVPGGRHSPCPLVSPAFADNRAPANSFDLAACPAVPEVGGTAPPNVANGVHPPFLLLPLGGATDGGAGAGVPPPHAANNLLLAHPGPAGAANNLAASRQNQQRVANAAVAGVDGIIYIDEVDAESMRRPQNRDNIEALDGINNAMLQATRMISQAIGRAHQPPATAAAAVVAPLPNAAARPLRPGGDGDVIASLYARLVSARAANRTDAVDRYERMIDRLERKEEEELESRLLKHSN
jgi:hypothetical protein